MTLATTEDTGDTQRQHVCPSGWTSCPPCPPWWRICDQRAGVGPAREEKMNSSDHSLGMHRDITRRDFLNGVSLGVVGSLLAAELIGAFEQEFAPERAPDYYPPTRTGMRGSHDGSFEVAHQFRDRRPWDVSAAINTGESYDLVVVGGGLSGLAAAHYFIKEVGRGAKVLVLDNHDDFGGHAKRNELHHNGRMLALTGGTLNIESPLRYNLPARQLLQDVGIDLDLFVSANA